jgi:predicted Zn finger-like uncharacterized protein
LEPGVKFLCDRCKTRYSIGDDRVRGKILKIRCKNCGNVITVREGMVPEPEAVPPPEYAGRTKPSTTTSPAAYDERAAEAATVPARQVANASPASTAVGRAKEPAAARPVAKEPAASGAPKLARGEATFGQPESRGQGGRRPDDSRRGEPVNALNAAFASAMAKPPPALEEEWYVSIDGVQSGPFSLVEAQRWVGQKPFDAELHCWSEGFDDWLPVDKVSHFRGLRKRPVPAPAPPPLPRAGGSPRPVVAAQAAAPVTLPIEDQSKPLFAATMATLERAAPSVSSPGIHLPPATPSARATPAHGVAYPGNGINGINGAPRVEESSLKPEPKMMPRPGAWPQPRTGPDAPGAAAPPYADPFAQHDRADAQAAGTPGAGGRAAGHVEGENDGELHIGEVSRVVNLADLVRAPRPGTAPARRAATAAATRLSSANPSLGGTGSVASIGGAPAIAPEVDPAMTMAPVAKVHRRGLITLLTVATVLVLGVAAAVILFVDTATLTGGRLGQVHDIDTSRPDDPTHHPLPGTTAPVPPPNPFIPRPIPRPRPIPPVDPGHDPDPPPGGSLRSEEIEDMARKHQDMSTRCYMRSQRGSDAINVGEVKKITVTLTIDRDGSVTDVGLSEHAADNLGKCLITSMKTWKFRVSGGGAFRISLNFVGN